MFKKMFKKNVEMSLCESAIKEVEKLVDLIDYSFNQAIKIKKMYKGEDVSVSAEDIIKKIKDIRNILSVMEQEARYIKK